MPEIAEVERARTILEQCLKNQTIIDVEAFDDPLVFKDTTAQDFAATLKGKKVVAVKRWGKYFWMEMDSPPHPVMHFGMTGWIRVKGCGGAHYYPSKDEDEWPPRFVKFIIKVADQKTKPNFEGSMIPDVWGTEIAFVDARRLGRVRLVEAKDPFTVPPLNELGFDPILKMPDFETFAEGVLKRKVPIKALLLDQTFSAGVGNWVADEVLFQSCIHPEQYSNTIPKSTLQTLYEKIHSVTTIAAKVLGDSSKFPDDWLFSYRWGKGRTKGKKGQGENNVLPTGEKITHVTVGGRTSAVVESRQKKIKGAGNEDEMVEEKPVKKGKKAKEEVELEEDKKAKRKTKKEEPEEEETTPKKRRVNGRQPANGSAKNTPTPTRKSSRAKAS